MNSGTAVLASSVVGRVACVMVFLAPAVAMASPAARDVAVGAVHSCAVLGTGRVACWGGNYNGQLPGAARGAVGAAVLVEGIADGLRIAASAEQTCVLRAGGRVTCWNHGNLAVPPHDVKVPAALDLAVAGDDGCVRSEKGEVHCWWRDRPPARVRGVNGAVELGLNVDGGCVRRRDGTVWCWGSWRLSRDWPREGVHLAVRDAVQLAVGLDNACGRLRGGAVRCWSRHDRPYQPHGLRGASDVLFVRGVPCIRRGAGVPLCQGHEPHEDEDPPPPRSEPLLQDLRVNSSNWAYGCGITNAGVVVCWGTNESGQLGRATPGLSARPVQVVGLDDAIAVATGDGHACALRRGGAVVCWGESLDGYGADRPSFTSRPRTMATAAPVVRLLPGARAGISAEGRIIGLGAHAHHSTEPVADAAGPWLRLRDGRLVVAPTVREAPRQLTAVDGVVQMSAGGYGLCLVYGDGRLGCHGYQFSGLPPEECSSPPGMHMHCSRAPPPSTPTIVARDVRQASLGAQRLCAVLVSGKVACRSVGDSRPFGEKVPFEIVPGLERVRVVAVDGSFRPRVCAARDDGRVFCWGPGSFGTPGGQWGWPVAQPASPVLVPGLEDAIDVALGQRHTCALRRGGRVSCWGNNELGQLGDGTSGIDPSPRPVEALGRLAK